MKNKQWYRVIVVELSFLAWPLVSFAQQPQSLTLSEAIQLALKSNRQLQAAQQYTDAAKSAAGQAKGAFLPRLDMMLTAAAVVVGASVILFDPIFQGLAISLIAGEVASLLLSRMTVPILYYLSERRAKENISPRG